MVWRDASSLIHGDSNYIILNPITFGIIKIFYGYNYTSSTTISNVFIEQYINYMYEDNKNICAISVTYSNNTFTNFTYCAILNNALELIGKISMNSPELCGIVQDKNNFIWIDGRLSTNYSSYGILYKIEPNTFNIL